MDPEKLHDFKQPPKQMLITGTRLAQKMQSKDVKVSVDERIIDQVSSQKPLGVMYKL